MAASFSDWWAKVIGVLTRSWQPLLIIQLATVVPGMLIADVTAPPADRLHGGVDRRGVVGVLGALILFVVALLAQGASVYVVGKQASGQEVGAGPALTFAAGRRCRCWAGACSPGSSSCLACSCSSCQAST